MIKQIIKLADTINDDKIKTLINSLLKLGSIYDISYNKASNEFTFYYEKGKINIEDLNNLLVKYEESNLDNNQGESITFTFDVSNLHCANCANKIEKNIAKIPGVMHVNLNFISKKLTITSLDYIESDLLTKVNIIAEKIEPGTKITKEHKHAYDHNHHYESSKYKYLSLIIGSLIFVLAYLSPFEDRINIALFFVSYTIIGYSVLENAIRNILKGQLFDENFLMAIATIGALVIREYHEAVAVMLFYEIGEIFQSKAIDRSRKAIKNLVEIQPKYANLVVRGEIEKVSPNQVKINDIIVVKPGEKIPLDGLIIDGFSTADYSSLTGESIPVNVDKDTEVLAGAINLNGTLKIKVTKNYVDTAVSKILKLVQEAQSKKAKVEKFITQFARVYTPIVIFLAILILFIPMFFEENYQFNEHLYNACVFLVVSCPCALVVSVPLSIFGGIGVSSKLGILIKGGNNLDSIRKADIIVFDKTGTLTKGNFVVTKAKAVIGYEIKRFLYFAAHAESLSNHVVGKAIVKYANISIKRNLIENHEEIFGHGIKATIDNNEVLVGNDKLMKKYNINYKEINEVGSIVYVAVNKKYVGFFVIADEIKEGAKATIANIKKLGVRNILMLTGDSNQVASKVADYLEIDEYYAELLPEDKLKILKKIKRENPLSKIMFIGDGVNDTPVMALSDVSVAMGALGSDAAIEVADVVIMNDELDKIISSKKIATLTHKKVWQNIIFALSIKFIVLGLSTFGYIYIWAAVFADVGVTLIAVLNSISILKFKNK